ncbi:MAG TPA: glycosyltransferase family 9 protein, partial [Candidatus Goldiibacteriota bacterium]|nr:glycosyltransferase family 9 protein [Candidatus Goldiibacteriota bacterium]
EKEAAQSVIRSASIPSDSLFLAPQTDIKQLAALIKRMDIFISNDCGPKHIAVAVGTPTVTIFGPTNSISWADECDGFHAVVRAEVNCGPCDKMVCPGRGNICMEGITPECVKEEAEKIMAKRRGGKR